MVFSGFTMKHRHARGAKMWRRQADRLQFRVPGDLSTPMDAAAAFAGGS
jgi:hypothetical protein